MAMAPAAVVRSCVPVSVGGCSHAHARGMHVQPQQAANIIFPGGNTRRKLGVRGQKQRVALGSGGICSRARASHERGTPIRAQSDRAEMAEMEELVPRVVQPRKTQVPKVPFVQVEVITDKPGPMTILGSLDMPHFQTKEVYEILTDHESSNRIFRTILDVERTDNADGSIRLVQNCKWKFALFSGSFPVELEVREEPENNLFTFKNMKQGGFMKEMYGKWTVQPSSIIPGGVNVRYNMSVQMALAPPPPFGTYTGKIFVAQVNEILTDLQLELEQRYRLLDDLETGDIS